MSADHLDLLGTGYNTINNGGPNEYSLRTDFILERGGKRAARIDSPRHRRRIAELEFQDAMRRLIFDVESAFLDVQVAKENLALAQDNLKSLNGIVSINTERVRTGDLAGVELERSRIAALQYRDRRSSSRVAAIAGSKPAAASDRRDRFGGRFRCDRTDPARRRGNLTVEQVRGKARNAFGRILLETRQAQARNQMDLRLQIAQGRIDYTAGTEYRRQQAPSGMGNSLGFFCQRAAAGVQSKPG